MVLLLRPAQSLFVFPECRASSFDHPDGLTRASPRPPVFAPRDFQLEPRTSSSMDANVRKTKVFALPSAVQASRLEAPAGGIADNPSEGSTSHDEERATCRRINYSIAGSVSLDVSVIELGNFRKKRKGKEIGNDESRNASRTR